MMKARAMSLLIFLSMVSFVSQAQKNDNPNKWLTTSAELTYHFSNITNEYDFVVSELQINKTVSFKWKMSEPVNYSGTVKISEGALDSALSMVNYFADKSAQSFTDRTTVWQSRKVYRKLKDKLPAEIYVDKKSETLNFRSDTTYKVLMDGADTQLTVIYAETSSGYKFWILDDPRNPLIVKMQLVFLVELLSVKTAK